MADFYHIWVYLSASPLLHLAATLLAYQVGDVLYKRANYHPLANPLLFSIGFLVLLLWITDTSYKTYFDGAQFVHFLLGPATVALAVPLYRAYSHIRQSMAAIGSALIFGCCIAVISVTGLAYMLGASQLTLLSLAPKSVTTPIAMAIASEIGGTPSLAAVFVILTGIIGAIVAVPVLDFMRVSDQRARGFATGLTAHGMGTAIMLRSNELAGAFAGLAMSLNGLASSILVPLLMHFWKL